MALAVVHCVHQSFTFCQSADVCYRRRRHFPESLDGSSDSLACITFPLPLPSWLYGFRPLRPGTPCCVCHLARWNWEDLSSYYFLSGYCMLAGVFPVVISQGFALALTIYTVATQLLLYYVRSPR